MLNRIVPGYNKSIEYGYKFVKLELLYVQLKFYKILEDSNKISVITSVSISSHSSELDSLSVMSPLSSELSSSSIVSRLIFC